MTSLKDIIAIHRPKPRYKILPEISSRWSPRFYSDQIIPLHHLKQIFEAARFAPSGHNQQPWHFYYAKKGSQSYQKLFSTLNDYNQSWAKTAPLLILACVETKNKYGINLFAFYDLGAAVISLVLQSRNLGYYARQMGLFDKKTVRNLFKINEDTEPFIIIAMGKIGDYKKAPREIIDLELDPRLRKTDIFTEL
jgi:nitroreductase